MVRGAWQWIRQGRHSNRLLIVVAVVFGLITAVFVYAALSDGGEEEKVSTGPSATMKVVVAERHISARTKITADMLDVKEIPADVGLRGVYSDTTPLVGRLTVQSIEAGEPILPVKLTEEGHEEGLAFVVPPGKRAISVEVSQVIGAGGLIVPGDYVDVIAVLDEDEVGRDKAVTILQNVQVLAVAQNVQDVVAQSDGAISGQDGGDGAVSTIGSRDNDAEADPDAQTVTLATTLEQAQLLFLAENKAELRLVLRAFGETEVQPVTESNFTAYGAE